MRSLSSDLSAKIKQSLQTIGNNSQPKTKITVARAKTTVTDSNYWTVETIRTKSGISDIALAPRRFYKHYGGPDRIYEIHVDNSIVKTSIREYPDKLKDGWKPQFELGPGTDVAIAFDGDWELYKTNWRFRSHEKPWIFWVNAEILYGQLWDDETTMIELATGVSRVSAIRGWNNKNFLGNDQGVIVSYIKSGRPYYKAFAYQTDGSQLWELERELVEFVGVAQNIGLFLTNDYRMGFAIENDLGIVYWLITTRCWAGMGITPEYIKASVSGGINVIDIEKINANTDNEYITAQVSGEVLLKYTLSDNQFLNISNKSIEMLDEESIPYMNWGYKIHFITEHDFTNVTVSDFSIKDELNTNFIINSIIKITNKEYELNTVNFNNAYGNMTVSFDGTGITKGEIGQTLDNFIATFTPQNLVPEYVPLPEVEVIWNE